WLLLLVSFGPAPPAIGPWSKNARQAAYDQGAIAVWLSAHSNAQDGQEASRSTDPRTTRGPNRPRARPSPDARTRNLCGKLLGSTALDRRLGRIPRRGGQARRHPGRRQAPDVARCRERRSERSPRSRTFSRQLEGSAVRQSTSFRSR